MNARKMFVRAVAGRFFDRINRIDRIRDYAQAYPPFSLEREMPMSILARVDVGEAALA